MVQNSNQTEQAIEKDINIENKKEKAEINNQLQIQQNQNGNQQVKEEQKVAGLNNFSDLKQYKDSLNNLVNFSQSFNYQLPQNIPYLGTIQEAPQYIVDNIYILTGYRINFVTTCQILKSLFMVHNETLNIWTHLIGCFIAIALCVDLSLYDPFPGHEINKWPIYVFVSSGMACMFFSSSYHLFFVKNAKLAKILLRMDYAGICFLICGSTYPLTYYGFYCKQEVLWFYLTLNSVASLTVFAINMCDFIYTEKYRTLKSVLYALLGVFCAIPLFHLLVQEFFEKTIKYNTLQTLPYYIIMGLVDYGGLFIYSQRCPEKQYPGRFDIWGNSHQIMHVSNVIGTVATYYATTIHFYDRLNNMCPSQIIQE